jgi:uncharacterized coiled-coil protein SlyX
VADEDRVEMLEFKLAHLERGLQELSDVVVRQQHELEQARRRVEQLGQVIESLQQDAGAPQSEFEVPPHY